MAGIKGDGPPVVAGVKGDEPPTVAGVKGESPLVSEVLVVVGWENCDKFCFLVEPETLRSDKLLSTLSNVLAELCCRIACTATLATSFSASFLVE